MAMSVTKILANMVVILDFDMSTLAERSRRMQGNTEARIIKRRYSNSSFVNGRNSGTNENFHYELGDASKAFMFRL